MELWERSSIGTGRLASSLCELGLFDFLFIQELQQIQAEIWIKAGLKGTFWGGTKHMSNVLRGDLIKNSRSSGLCDVWKADFLSFLLPLLLPCLRFLAFHLTPGLSQGNWGGGDGRWGLKCNPGPVTTKAVAPEGQWQTTYSELQCYPSANPSEWLHFTGLHGRTPLCTSNAPP